MSSPAYKGHDDLTSSPILKKNLNRF